jgi:hypothetical protein
VQPRESPVSADAASRCVLIFCRGRADLGREEHRSRRRPNDAPLRAIGPSTSPTPLIPPRPIGTRARLRPRNGDANVSRKPTAPCIGRRRLTRVRAPTTLAFDHRPTANVSGSAVRNRDFACPYVSGTGGVKSRPAHLRFFSKNRKRSDQQQLATVCRHEEGAGRFLAAAPCL